MSNDSAIPKIFRESLRATMKTQLVIVQPTPLCNIDCRYCYLPNRTSNARMSKETLAHLFKALFACDSIREEIRIAWHAGEPLTLPIAFYEEAFELLRQMNTRQVKVKNSFQTNATLLDQRWCDFIKAHDVDVGVSIDGPQELHDLNRVDRAGKGTFGRTMRGIKLLQQSGIPVQVIVVLTRQALGRADDVWQFFMAQNIRNLAFNVEEIEGVHTHSSLQSDQAMSEYRAFLARISDLRDAHPIAVYVRELDELWVRIQYAQGAPQSSLSAPMGTLNFDYKGNFSTFSPELLTMHHPVHGSFLFGNVATDSLDSLIANPKFNRIHDEIQRGIQRCAATCDYFQLCGGGATAQNSVE
jgi:uncharacterized protein